jgi:rare lipoprotein A
LRPMLFPVLVVAGLGLAGCAQQPQQQLAHSSEYFPESIYGRASPRVVADGQPIPHGGGTYMVGKPYTIAGKTYYPADKHYAAVGYASWYGDAFHGRRTANGEIYDRGSISAAHPTMPLPSYARVTNLRNNYSMIVRVNDRGPYAAGRIMDVSRQVAESLDFRRTGTAKVKVEYVGPASLAGSDDSKLIATLRNDGGPAQLDGVPRAPTMVAEAVPVRTASAEPTPLPTPREEAAEAPPVPPQHTTTFAGTAPLPPTRPFDLGTIPGAGVAIGQRQANLTSGLTR